MARAFEKEHVQEQEVLLQNIERIDIGKSCFSKVYLTAWRNSCCPDWLAIDTSNTDTFCKNGLSIHYRSSRKEFKENEAVQQGIDLLQEFVAKETFNNLQTLSEMRRNSVSDVFFLST